MLENSRYESKQDEYMRQVYVLTDSLSFPRCLYFWEYILFYTFFEKYHSLDSLESKVLCTLSINLSLTFF